MRAYIGVEGVGMRRIVGVVSDEAGNIVAAHNMVGRPLSLHTTPEQLLHKLLIQLLTALKQKAHLSPNDFENATVCIGLTGTTFRFDRHLFLPRVFQNCDLRFNNLICTGDVEIVFASHAANMNGAAILCHNGSTAYAVRSDNDTTEHFRVGGWGPVIGDEGSGYWMGCQALRAIAREHELRQPASILWNEIDNWFHDNSAVAWSWRVGGLHWEQMERDVADGLKALNIPLDKRSLIYHLAHKIQPHGHATEPRDRDGMEFWRQVASGIVIPLFRAYHKSDQAAQRIVFRASAFLVDQLRSAIHLCFKHSASSFRGPIVLYGGVMNFNPCFRSLMIDRILQARIPVPEGTVFIASDTPGVMRPACGALLFALGGSRTGDLRLPSAAVILNVRESQKSPQVAQDLKYD